MEKIFMMKKMAENNNRCFNLEVRINRKSVKYTKQKFSSNEIPLFAKLFFDLDNIPDEDKFFFADSFLNKYINDRYFKIQHIYKCIYIIKNRYEGIFGDSEYEVFEKYYHNDDISRIRIINDEDTPIC